MRARPQIRSSFQGEWWATEDDERNQRGRNGVGYKIRTRRFEQLRKGEIEPREVITGAPSLWTLSHLKNPDVRIDGIHTPDLVLNREPLRKGAKPLSVAFEVELNKKSMADMKAILRAYDSDDCIYGLVVWLVEDENVGKFITKAAQEIGMRKPCLVRYVPDHDGAPFAGEPWAL